MADGSEGSHKHRIKGARHAHAAMRAKGRNPGDAGRAAIAWNREVLKRDSEEHERESKSGSSLVVRRRAHT